VEAATEAASALGAGPASSAAPRHGPDLADAIAGLPPRQKQAVAYHYLAGLPYAEVAAIMGGTAPAARRAAADGIAALRRAYALAAKPLEGVTDD
jgi:DNA-directed RNA polymerase specialized sigma24 family protein